ncbi:glycosyltransferase [Paenibacillus sp. M1]|uniref:Glycosyltransferase n=1 Tax=Paenibacillus haidiansis TaxID=1574488 RepID=A0ABU7VX09_9BACL
MTLKCSVVIPVYNRSHLLKISLQSLNNQTLPKSEYEVVIVDDGSNDEIGTVMKGLNVDYDYKYIRLEKHHSASRARNEGILRSEGAVIVFLDGDQIAPSDFLREHLLYHESYDNFLVSSYRTHLKNIPDALPDNLEDLEIERYDVRHKVSAMVSNNWSRLKAGWHLCFTNNLSVRREHLQGEGALFDEEFMGWGLEDCEFAYRLWKKGLKIALNPRAFVHHMPHPANFDLKRFEQWQKNLDLFCKKHPAPEVLAQRVFIDRFHPDTRNTVTWNDCYLRLELICELLHNNECFKSIPKEIILVKDSKDVLSCIEMIRAISGGDKMYCILDYTDDPALEIEIQKHEFSEYMQLWRMNETVDGDFYQELIRFRVEGARINKFF